MISVTDPGMRERLRVRLHHLVMLALLSMAVAPAHGYAKDLAISIALPSDHVALGSRLSLQVTVTNTAKVARYINANVGRQLEFYVKRLDGHQEQVSGFSDPPPPPPAIKGPFDLVWVGARKSHQVTTRVPLSALGIEEAGDYEIVGCWISDCLTEDDVDNGTPEFCHEHTGTLVVHVDRPGQPEYTTRVELRRVGDDGLTVRFGDAVEKAIRQDRAFTLDAGKGADGTRQVVATIEGNLAWKSVGSHIEVTYKIRLDDSTGNKIGTSVGTCWEDELSRCAARAIADLRRAAKQAHKAGRAPDAPHADAGGAG